MEREKRKRIKKRSDKVLGILFIICLVFFVAANMLVKDREISEAENRSLTQKPVLSLESVMSGSYMKQFESYMSDQFAGRNLWRRFNVTLERIGGSREENGVYLGKKKQLMEEIAVPDKKTSDANIQSINEFAGRHEEIDTTVLLVPDAGEVLKKSLPPLASLKDQTRLFTNAKEQLAEQIKWIDAVSVMEKHKDEKIYYKTDHHWTSLGAYYTFLESAKILGIDEETPDEYSIYPVTAEFNGALSSTSGFCPKEKEEIEVYLPKEEVSVLVNYVDEQKKSPSLYDVSKLKTKDKYAVFLGRNSSVIDIKTTSPSDRVLLLVKDSFANSFVPFLASCYKEIVMVDPRYYAGTMEDVMDTYQITEVLILYSGNTFFQDNNISGVLSDA